MSDSNYNISGLKMRLPSEMGFHLYTMTSVNILLVKTAITSDNLKDLLFFISIINGLPVQKYETVYVFRLH